MPELNFDIMVVE